MRKLSVLFVLALLMAGMPSYAGVYYTAKTTAEGSRGADAQNATVQAWVSGDNAKVVFEQSGNPMMSKGMYMVTKDGGKAVYMVNPEEKSYFKWDMDSLMGMAGGMMKMMNMTYADPKVEKLSEEPDGLVAGLPTIHYKFHTSYTMSMSMMMIKKKMHVVKDEEIWAAPKLVEAGPRDLAAQDPAEDEQRATRRHDQGRDGQGRGVPAEDADRPDLHRREGQGRDDDHDDGGHRLADADRARLRRSRSPPATRKPR